MRFVLLFLAFCEMSFAAGPVGGAIQGTLFGPGGTPVTSSNVRIKLQVLDATGTCSLYEETHTGVDVSATNGDFSIDLGSGGSATNFVDGSAVLKSNVFRNDVNIATPLPGCGAGLIVATGDSRAIRVMFDVTGGASFVTLVPDMKVQGSPYSTIAESAISVQGKTIDMTAVSAVAGDKFAMMWDQALNKWVARALAADDITSAAGKYLTYAPNNVACTAGQVLKWTASNRWECGTDNDTASSGDITSVTANSPLLGGGTTGAVSIGINVGTGPNQVLQLNGSSQIPAVDGSLMTFVNAVRLQTYDVAATVPLLNQVLKFNGSRWEPAADADSGGDVMGVVALSPLTGGGTSGTVSVGIDTTLLTGVDAGKLQSRLISSVAPTIGQILKWNGSAWIPTPDSDAGGDITATINGVGILGGVPFGDATISVDVGIGAFQQWRKVLPLTFPPHNQHHRLSHAV